MLKTYKSTRAVAPAAKFFWRLARDWSNLFTFGLCFATRGPAGDAGDAVPR